MSVKTTAYEEHGFYSLKQFDDVATLKLGRNFLSNAIDLANLEFKKARRYQTPISFLYLDIDNFKRINDHFGHPVGDQLLRSVAYTIENNIRAIDLIVRFGGDEFGI